MAEKLIRLGRRLATITLVAVFSFTAFGQEKTPEAGRIVAVNKPDSPSNIKKGRPPVIIIPGLIDSELINQETGDKVWFDIGRAKDDDIRLPISSTLTKNRDNLVSGDILREIQLIRFTPKIDIYQKFIRSIEKDGFSEGKIDSPPEDGHSDTFYVFAYDWRLDNVHNAQLLLEKIDGIRSKLNRPDLKFDIIAHSMGGLITRYALMYGKADLSTKAKRPNWGGANYFNNIMLVGTPNGGSLSSLDSLLNGFSLFGTGKINIPFVRNLTKFDLFTLPSIYQLLPHDGMVRAFDENLNPLKVDIYSVATWKKYGWLVFDDKDFPGKFSEADRAHASSYFEAVLKRAKLFQSALNAKPVVKNPVPIYYLGSECKQTIDGMIIYKDQKQNIWKTQFDADSYTKSDGTKVKKEELEKIIFAPGDGVVSKRSLLSSLKSIGKLENLRSGLLNDLTIVCEEHNRLTGEEGIDRSVLSVLNLSVKTIVDKPQVPDIP